jgi:hypothetical protein
MKIFCLPLYWERVYNRAEPWSHRVEPLVCCWIISIMGSNPSLNTLFLPSTNYITLFHSHTSQLNIQHIPYQSTLKSIQYTLRCKYQRNAIWYNSNTITIQKHNISNITQISTYVIQYKWYNSNKAYISTHAIQCIISHCITCDTMNGEFAYLELHRV